jgi:hypothetical protein
VEGVGSCRKIGDPGTGVPGAMTQTEVRLVYCRDLRERGVWNISSGWSIARGVRERKGEERDAGGEWCGWRTSGQRASTGRVDGERHSWRVSRRASTGRPYAVERGCRSGRDGDTSDTSWGEVMAGADGRPPDAPTKESLRGRDSRGRVPNRRDCHECSGGCDRGRGHCG